MSSPGRTQRLNVPKTHFLIWLAAIICTILAIAVIIGGIVVFIGYLVIHPRIPVISVTYAHLDLLQYDQTGLLETQLNIVINMKNGNLKAHASFYKTYFSLTFDGLVIAKLLSQPFEVSKNSSQDFNYVVQSRPIPLDPQQQELVDSSIKRDEIRFGLKGSSRARWRVGLLGSVKFLCRLDCELRFHPSNQSYIPSRCSSKAK